MQLAQSMARKLPSLYARFKSPFDWVLDLSGQ